MVEELKPVRCGCGGEAEVLNPSYTHCKIIACSRCGIRTPYMNTEAEAVSAWNRAMGNRYELKRFERTTKVERYSFGETLTYDFDGQCKCGKWVDALWDYCPSCGCRLEWA